MVLLGIDCSDCIVVLSCSRNSCDYGSDHPKAVPHLLPINPSQRKGHLNSSEEQNMHCLHRGSPCQNKVPSRQDRGKQVRHRDVDIQVNLLHTGMKVSIKKIPLGNIDAGFTGLASW